MFRSFSLTFRALQNHSPIYFILTHIQEVSLNRCSFSPYIPLTPNQSMGSGSSVFVPLVFDSRHVVWFRACAMDYSGYTEECSHHSLLENQTEAQVLSSFCWKRWNEPSLANVDSPRCLWKGNSLPPSFWESGPFLPLWSALTELFCSEKRASYIKPMLGILECFRTLHFSLQSLLKEKIHS